jgi:AhpC/TSA antioxidant enzyme
MTTPNLAPTNGERRDATEISIADLLRSTRRQRVSDGAMTSILEAGSETGGATGRCLVVVLPQLGDFDSVEYAQWLGRTRQHPDLRVRAIAIGDRAAGQRFCDYTGFPADCLFVDPMAALHRDLGLYSGLTIAWPGLNGPQRAWLNLMLMCAGIGSPGTLGEVFRGYLGDRRAPQLIGAAEEVKAGPLPPLTGATFDVLGQGFQRPFELATLRLRNMSEVLGRWSTYVPDATYLTQRGGTFLVDRDGTLMYEHRDRGILGFAANMANPLAFLDDLLDDGLDEENSIEPTNPI